MNTSGRSLLSARVSRRLAVSHLVLTALAVLPCGTRAADEAPSYQRIAGGLWEDLGWTIYDPNVGYVITNNTPPADADVILPAVSLALGLGTKTVRNLTTLGTPQLYADGQWGNLTGTLVVTGPASQIDGLSINGGLEVLNQGIMTWAGTRDIGSMDVFRFRNAAGASFLVDIAPGVTRNVTMGYYSGYFSNEGATVTNIAAGATLKFANGYYGGAQTNSGLWIKEGAGVLDADNFANGATAELRVTGGTVLARRGEFGGVVKLSAGTALQITSDADLKHGFETTGAGEVQLSGSIRLDGDVSLAQARVTSGQAFYSSTLEHTASIGNLHLEGGALGSSTTQAIINANGAGSTITGSARIDSNRFTAAPTLLNTGTMTWSGGNLFAFDYFKVGNAAGGTFVAEVAAGLTRTMDPGYYGGWFLNEGTFTKTGAGTADFSVYFWNDGQVAVDGGTLTLRGSGSSSGSFAIASGAQLVVQSGTFALQHGATSTGGGVLDVNGGGLTVAGTASLATLRVSGGQAGYNSSATGQLNVGNLHLVAGALGSSDTRAMITASGAVSTITGSARIDSNRTTEAPTLLNTGTMTWSGGNLFASDYFKVGNAAGGTFVAEVGANLTRTMNPGYYGGWFHNEGTFTKTGAGTADFSVYFWNDGHVAVDGGTLTLRGSGSSTGSFTIAEGAQVVLQSGTFALENGAAMTGDGVLEVNGGGLSVAGTAAVAHLRIVGGDVGYGHTVANSRLTVGDLQMTGGALGASNTKTLIVHTGAAGTLAGNVRINSNPQGNTPTLQNEGGLTWSGSLLYGQDYFWMKNAVGGTFTATVGAGATQDLSPGYYGGWFINEGTFTKTGAGTTRVFTSFTHDGTLRVEGGRLQLHGPVGFGATASLELAGGTLASNSALTIGGTLRGSGAIESSVTVTGTLAPGASPGLIAISGNLVLAATSQTRFELAGFTAGSGYDRVTATGSVTLGGDFGLTVDPTFAQQITTTTTFDLISGSSLGGTFANAVSGTRLADLGGLGSFLIAYDGRRVSLSDWIANPSAVPEPATWGVWAGAGVLGLAAFRRRRRTWVNGDNALR